MTTTTKTLVTGIQPTGRLHIGNYFGAFHQFVELQNTHESYFFIADLHAITSSEIQKDSQKFNEFINNIVLDSLALGVNPDKTCIYNQSEIPEISEIMWILSNFITVPTLSLGHAYKAAKSSKKELMFGLFAYPLLMASDILSVSADVVPVGKDQKQHLELTREIARKFNSNYKCDLLKIPGGHFCDMEEVVGTDGRKMSKSYKNTIPLFSGKENIKKSVMGIITDSKKEGEPLDPSTCTVFKYHTIFSKGALSDIEGRYKSGKINYKESKEILVDSIISYFAPFEEKRKEYENNSQLVSEILEKGTAQARGKIVEILNQIKKTVGIL